MSRFFVIETPEGQKAINLDLVQIADVDKSGNKVTLILGTSKVDITGADARRVFTQLVG